MMATLTHNRETWRQHNATATGRRYWPSEELVRFVGRRGGAIGRRVLEVGCGNGANLWFLAEHAIEVDGLDFCEGALREAGELLRWRGKDNVRLTRGDAEALPYADESFDGVADLMVSQHVPWDAHVPLIKEYRRVLRPGGWLFLYHLTSRTSGGDQDQPDVERLDLFPGAGLTCLLPGSTLARMVSAAGFDDVEMSGMAREYPNGLVAHYAVITAAR